MKALANEYGERVFAISDKEWFGELTFGMKAEDIGGFEALANWGLIR